ncbi:hypothetical protein CsSME_00023173 [Camellia sinensis var. sinensis]
MSSWLSISLPNPFKSDDQNLSPPSQHSTPSSGDHSPTVGVKEDLSVLGQTIGRQLRGVAAFLAPPPPPQPPPDSSSQTLVGIRNDLVEIGGSFKSSLSLLSSNKAVSEISRLASNLLQFETIQANEVEGDDEDEDEDEDDEDDGSEVAGVTDEVLHFVQEISSRSEFWTDFPLSLDNDFVMSDAQKEHASTVEDLVPNFAALRHQTCSSLSEEKFWMIYFILLLPRLHEHDAKLLSTPEIVEARRILLQKLHENRNTPVEETSDDSPTINLSQEGERADNTQGHDSPSQGKEVLAESASEERDVKIHHENTDQWLEEEDVDDAPTSSAADAQKQPETEEDVSFSDLEDDDNDLSGRLSSRFKPSGHERVASPNGSNEWVRLNESSGTRDSGLKNMGSTSREKDSEGEDSNDWLTVDDVDSDSVVAV